MKHHVHKTQKRLLSGPNSIQVVFVFHIPCLGLCPLIFPGLDADVFIVCFDLTSEDSLRNASSFWMDEIDAKHCDIPVVVVALLSRRKNLFSFLV